jgi:phosphoglucomutase
LADRSSINTVSSSKNTGFTGTEDVLRLYAESFKSQSHLEAMLEQAQEILGKIIGE